MWWMLVSNPEPQNLRDIYSPASAVGSHYGDVTMGTIASLITSLMIVYSTIYSGADQSKHQSSASLAFVWGNHRGPVNSPHKWPVTRKMFPFHDVIMVLTTTPWPPVQNWLPLVERYRTTIGRVGRFRARTIFLCTAYTWHRLLDIISWKGHLPWTADLRISETHIRHLF